MSTNKIQQNRDLIRRYKTDISLVSYLDSIGFVVDRAHYSQRWPVMKDEVTGRKLIIGRNQNTTEYFYYNPSDTTDRGSIIDLLAERHKLDLQQKGDWDALHQVASELIGNVYLTRHEHVAPQPIQAHTRDSAITAYFKLDELKDTAFLEHDRRLSRDTIFAPEFTNKIFNKPFVDKTVGIAGKNTTFPIENREGIIGIMNRNPTWNQIQGSKDDGVWVSNILPHQPIRELLIFEAPIDALSYHQLYKPAQPGACLYVATAGTVTTNQHATIQYLIEQTKPQVLVLGMDNDLQGIRYNINLLGKLHMPGQPNTGIDIHVSNSQHTNRMKIEIDHRKAIGQGVGPSIDSIIQRISEVMNRGFPVDAPKAGVSLISKRADHTTVEVTFPNIRPLLVRAETLTRELRQTADRMVVHRAVENDFNEDLQLKTLKQQLQQETGIKLSAQQLSNLNKTGRTDIVLDNQGNPGKVVVDYSKTGPTLHFVKRREQLTMPASFKEYILTELDNAQLKATGLLHHRIEITHPISEQRMHGFLGVDTDLNQLTFLPAERLKTRNLYNLNLTDEQTRQILQGKVIDVGHTRAGETTTFRVGVDLIRSEISVTPVKPPCPLPEPTNLNTTLSARIDPVVTRAAEAEGGNRSAINTCERSQTKPSKSPAIHLKPKV